MKTNLLYAFTAVILSSMPNVNFGQAPDLGTSSDYALFTAVGAFNNIGATTTVTGDVGTNVGAFNAFPPGILVGQKNVANSASAQAATDVDVAYSFLAEKTCGTVIGTTLGSGQNLKPDVYCLGAASTLNGDLILDGEGDPSSLFIFKINGALATTVNSRVVLTNSASLCNVYWQVNGQVDLGSNSLFQGTILANGAINLLEGATLLGRGLSRSGAISLSNNIVTKAGGSTASTITASGPTTLCPGGSVILSGNNGGTWSNGATTPTITVGTAGDYFVTNPNVCGGSVTSNHIIVTVNSQLSCTITGDDSFCAGESTELCVPFSVSSTYLWSTGATTNCITVSTAGAYSVTVSKAEGCTSTCTKTVTVTTGTASIITASGPTTICPAGSVILSGNNGGTWSNGATTPTITVTTAGDYFVTNPNVCGGSVTSNHIIVTVNSNLSCTFTGNDTFCIGEKTELCVPFSASSTYLWNTGATTNCITATTAGTYSVTVTTAEGCISTCSQKITVTPAPSCNITGKSTICEGSSTSLCAPVGNGYTYLWSTGATSRCITATTAGIFSVTVTIDKKISSICSKTVTISPAPICTLEGPSAICQGQSTQLCVPSSDTSTYLWSTGATTNCISLSEAGTYSVTVTTADGCKRTCVKSVKVTSAPSCIIEGSSTISQGQSTQLCTPYGSGYTYLWSNGATTRCITVNTAGTFSVTVNKDGCSSQSTCSKTVTLTDNPICIISGSSSVCEGQATQLCAPYGKGFTYLWSNGATSRCITTNGAGTFSVTVNNNGRSSTCSKTVTSAPPACGISGSSTICEGTSTSLCAPYGSGYTYLWSNGATSRCIPVASAGTYSLELTKNGCTSTCSKTVTVAAPSSTITVSGAISGSGSTTICEGTSTSLCAPRGYGYAYLWSTGATSRCISVDAAGTFSLTVTEKGCSSTSSETVTVNPIPVCSISGDLHPDKGQSTTLCAPSGMTSYKWSTGETTACITVDCTGTYTVVTDLNGCISSCNTYVTSSCSSKNASAMTSSSGNTPDGNRVADRELNIKVNAYPNPFYSTAIIEFQNAESDSHVVVELFSTTENKVSTLFNGDVKPGALHKIEVNAGDLPKGVYIYRITNGYGIINRKLVLIR